MSLRFSIEEAQEKGWITKEQAAQQKAQLKNNTNRIVDDGRRGKLVTVSKEGPSKPSSQERVVCSLNGDMPQEKLWRACATQWPTWLALKKLVWEYPGAVPGRRFRLDIAFPQHKLACEVDGWEHHGKYLSDFKRDRLRDRLLVQNGWRVLRFYAEEIHSDSSQLVAEINKALSTSIRHLAE